jgi:hypothetical protein
VTAQLSQWVTVGPSTIDASDAVDHRPLVWLDGLLGLVVSYFVALVGFDTGSATTLLLTGAP